MSIYKELLAEAHKKGYEMGLGHGETLARITTSPPIGAEKASEPAPDEDGCAGWEKAEADEKASEGGINTNPTPWWRNQEHPPTHLGQVAYFSGILPSDWQYTEPGEYAYSKNVGGEVMRKAVYVGDVGWVRGHFLGKDPIPGSLAYFPADLPSPKGWSWAVPVKYLDGDGGRYCLAFYG